MKWLKQILERRENERNDRQWLAQYSGHITDLERAIHFECSRCAEPDAEHAASLSYSISQAIPLAFRCYHCRTLLRLAEKE